MDAGGEARRVPAISGQILEVGAVTWLDDAIAGLGGGGLAMALVVAVLLGLRHATDPDHLTAVSTLVMSEGDDPPCGGQAAVRRAGRLGLAWGVGHALTLIVCGLPVVLFGRGLPDAVQHAAEVAIGAVIVALAIRLLIRWRRGYFHAHPHRHGERWHAHPHAHEDAFAGAHPDVHEHAHPEALGRSPLAAFGIGVVHGLGGSAGVAILLVGAIPGRLDAAIALTLFAVATAVSMALLSTGFGYALGRREIARRFERLVPALGTVSLVFGAWYAAVAL
jgi:ABC-type nickel/cobalt efflux system permease component RcnA